MTTTTLTYASATELARAIRAKEVSAAEVVDAHLRQIEAHALAPSGDELRSNTIDTVTEHMETLPKARPSLFLRTVPP